MGFSTRRPPTDDTQDDLALSIHDVTFPNEPVMPDLVRLIRKMQTAIWRNIRLLNLISRQESAGTQEYAVRQGSNTFAHGLNARPSGWLVVRVTGDKSINFYATDLDWAERDELTVTLQANDEGTAAIRFLV